MTKRELIPYWKVSHECWYVNFQGRTIRLHPDEKTAQDEYHKLMAGRKERGPDVLVAELILEFLKWSQRKPQASNARVVPGLLPCRFGPICVCMSRL